MKLIVKLIQANRRLRCTGCGNVAFSVCGEVAYDANYCVACDIEEPHSRNGCEPGLWCAHVTVILRLFCEAGFRAVQSVSRSVA